MKYFIILLITIACIWGYMNQEQISATLNLGGIKNQAEESMSHEKTIFGVNQRRKEMSEEAQKAMD